MTEREIKLLKMAIALGWDVIDQIRSALDYCEDARNDYFLMIQKLGEKIGIDLNDCY